MKTVSIPNEAHDLLDKIVEMKNGNKLHNRNSNRSVVTELIAREYKRVVKK